MRLRNVKNAKEIVKNSPFVVQNPQEHKGKYKELFGNNNPIHLEIGMGKGNFILDKAKKNPNINFIGLEKYDSIVCRALEKADVQQPSNLKIMCVDALELADIFDKEIDVIYLNFSDPWPKKRHAKRRLTSHVFLPIYDMVFSGVPTIIQKTDNVGLFESSVVSLSTYGYTIEEISLDLASTGMENSLTEYEAKFMSLGTKINYLKAIKK
jgi:tRNA (guanine-N7-)-methyltransferase